MHNIVIVLLFLLFSLYISVFCVRARVYVLWAIVPELKYDLI